jgi:hypothetical protein
VLIIHNYLSGGKTRGSFLDKMIILFSRNTLMESNIAAASYHAAHPNQVTIATL